ncbi:PucR family transcriptional regulator [Halobacillus litoralis]|uniref:PucR family transcriptional regulator n=1 Tax=Halobacillus litoralis TaxID=45668 RepID=UPI001CD2942F|nr:PucR family transcriptional regulator [Halobacillus litoralis]MCA1022406.1 PucR family transcriptional regulator [Halobacillus litoralis]
MSTMMFTVHDMLKRPPFQHASILAGRGGLQKAVSWAHILELTKVKHLLHGSECVMTTGIGWGKELQHARSFLEQLIEKKVTCLCIELGDYITHLPSPLLQLADDHDLPVLVFDKEVRFIDISKDINQLILQSSRLMPRQESWAGRWLEGTMTDKEALPYLEKTIGSREARGFPCLLTGYDDSIPYQRDIFQSFFQKEGFHPLTVQNRDELVLLLLDERREQVSERLARSLKRMKEKAGSMYHTISCGPLFTNLSEIPPAMRCAQEADHIQAAFQLEMPFYEKLHPWRLIIEDDKRGALESFIQDTLGDVLAYDEAHDTELLLTLRAYLESYGSKKDTAERLFIVRQTLYHRIQKLEEILGPHFLRSEQRMALEMALLGWQYIQSPVRS